MTAQEMKLILVKTFKVVDSCQTKEQETAARKYVSLVFKSMKSRIERDMLITLILPLFIKRGIEI